jgi:oligosaccharyl transferase STT3 subunit
VNSGALFRIVAIAAAAAAAAVGFARGTYVAGGSDSYCYLSQAELFASWRAVNEQPLAAQAPWTRGAEAFIPVGHVHAYARPGATVPMCPPGYPLLMAIARTIAGRAAMFTVVPVLGALAVWWTFVLGRRIGGDRAGAIAAVLLAASPAFLYQIVQPMSDVPAAALWAAALVCLMSDRFTRSIPVALGAGLATGAALIVRPNLVPCAAVAALAVFTRSGVGLRAVVRTWLAFAVGVAPFALVVAALQNTMYGGPLKSGYGDLDFLFRASHVWPNLQRYPLWLLQTETPIVLLALGAPVLADRRRTCIWLLAFVAAVFACYLPYEVFDAWWYLRFLLPAYPAMLALTACALSALAARLDTRWRVFEFAIVAALAVFMLRVTNERGTFGLRDFERRFRLAGDYVASHLPANAAVVTGQESGSVRFYAGRLTLFWRGLPADSLDRALDFLRAHGYKPYLLVETWEQPDFVGKFGDSSHVGALSWPAMVDINHDVRIYDPEDYGRYRAGVPLHTERVWTRR